MKNNYATIDISFLNYELGRFEYLEGRCPVYLVLSSETLSMIERKTSGVCDLSIAIDNELPFGDIIIL